MNERIKAIDKYLEACPESKLAVFLAAERAILEAQKEEEENA